MLSSALLMAVPLTELAGPSLSDRNASLGPNQTPQRNGDRTTFPKSTARLSAERLTPAGMERSRDRRKELRNRLLHSVFILKEATILSERRLAYFSIKDDSAESSERRMDVNKFPPPSDTLRAFDSVDDLSIPAPIDPVFRRFNVKDLHEIPTDDRWKLAQQQFVMRPFTRDVRVLPVDDESVLSSFSVDIRHIPEHQSPLRPFREDPAMIPKSDDIETIPEVFREDVEKAPVVLPSNDRIEADKKVNELLIKLNQRRATLCALLERKLHAKVRTLLTLKRVVLNHMEDDDGWSFEVKYKVLMDIRDHRQHTVMNVQKRLLDHRKCVVLRIHERRLAHRRRVLEALRGILANLTDE